MLGLLVLVSRLTVLTYLAGITIWAGTLFAPPVTNSSISAVTTGIYNRHVMFILHHSIS